jgi:hypothetical protein
MDDSLIIGHRRVNNHDRIQTIAGMPDICQMVEVSGVAINGLKMRDIFFFNP